MRLIKDIQPRRIYSAYVEAAFDRGKAELEKAGYHIPSFEENARLRMQEGENSFVSRTKNWVKEGFLYIPNKGKFLTKRSPIMAYPNEATEAHRTQINGTLLNEFSLTDEQIGVSLEDSLKLPDSDFSIPTKRFEENEITVYAFGNSAQDYGYFLSDAGIEEMPVKMDSFRDKTFARQAFFDGLGEKSTLCGFNNFLPGGFIVRGVTRQSLKTPSI
jgi:hypothetical protein